MNILFLGDIVGKPGRNIVFKYLKELKEKYPDTLTILPRAYEAGDEDGFKVVLSAVDEALVDQAIYEACKEKNIPVNIASDMTKNDFFFPALICDDDMVIGVCSGGRDHKKVARISQLIREKIFGNN